MQVQQLLLAYIIIIQIALIQFQMKEKFNIIGLMNSWLNSLHIDLV